MSEVMMPAVASNEPLARPQFYPWRDAEGREHPDIPKCCGVMRTRPPWALRGVERDCRRRGVVLRGKYGGRDAWFCLQHDPGKREERRVAELAPALLEVVRDALGLVARTKRSASWRDRAEALVGEVDKRGFPRPSDGGR